MTHRFGWTKIVLNPARVQQMSADEENKLETITILLKLGFRHPLVVFAFSSSFLYYFVFPHFLSGSLFS